MDHITRIEAEGQLSALIDRVEAGETIEITRDGRPVAQLSATANPRRRVDVARLKVLTDSLPYQDVSAGEFIRAMRDSDRY